MTVAALERLDLVISLIDRVSGPAAKVVKAMDAVNATVKSGYSNFVSVNSALMDTGSSLQKLVAPAQEMQATLAAISSLGDGQLALVNIDKTTAAATESMNKATEAVALFRTEFGDRLLVQMKPVYEKITLVSQTLVRWMELFPNLTGWVAKATIFTVGFYKSISLLSQAIAAGQKWMVGLRFALKPFGPLLGALKMGWVSTIMQLKAGKGIMAAMRIGLVSMTTQLKINLMATKIFRLGNWLLSGSFKLLKIGILTTLPAIWGFTTALLANPVTWIVLGITALIAALVAAVVYWDKWTAVVVDFGSRFLELLGVFDIVDAAVAVWDKLPVWWQGFKAFLANLNPFAIIGSSIDWLIDKINLIPGINIDKAQVSNVVDTLNPIKMVSSFFTDTPEPPKPVTGPESLASQQGASQPGLIQQISNASSANSSRSIGEVSVHNYGQPMNGQTLADEFAMAAG